MIAPGDVAGRRGGSRSVHGLRYAPGGGQAGKCGHRKAAKSGRL